MIRDLNVAASMQMIGRKLLLSVAMAPMIMAISPAQASVTLPLNMQFKSGAAFSGNVTFSNDYSKVEAVSGFLSGYQSGITGYQGSGSDSINWIWNSGANYSTGAGNYSTFLMDGPGSGYSNSGSYANFIQLAYNYSAAPSLSFTNGVSALGTDNYINYNDPLVSGSFSAAVPEPVTWMMMLVGFGMLGMALRSRTRTKVQVGYA